MHGFEPVTLTWKGEEYVVPADKQLLLIAKIEDALGGEQGENPVFALTRSGGPKLSSLSVAYAAALRYAGAEVSAAEVYNAIDQEMFSGELDAVSVAQEKCLELLAIVSPAGFKILTKGGSEKKQKAPNTLES